MVTVPAGTGVNVRLTEAIDVDSSRAGMTFKAVVDDPVIVDGPPSSPAARRRSSRPSTWSSQER